MRISFVAALAFASLAGVPVHADDTVAPGRRASRPSKEPWEFAITAYPTQVRGGDNTTSAIAVADRGPLHLEARYGYEAKDSRSAFVGWTFSGGETVSWELTPLLGGLGLGRYAGYGSWKAGLLMVGLGTALTVAIVALGG